MPILMGLALFACMLIAAPAPAAAQETAAGSATSAGESFRVVIEEMIAFTEDVEVSEQDLENVIEHWEGFSTLNEGENAGMDFQDWAEEGFDYILDSPVYRDWARAEGVDAEDWLRGAMRVQLIAMRRQLVSDLAGSDPHVEAQLEMLETQRDSLGEVRYQQMKNILEGAHAMMTGYREQVERIPPPTRSEEQAIARYSAELERLMM